MRARRLACECQIRSAGGIIVTRGTILEMIKTTCSKCRNTLEKRRYGKQRYCLSCSAEYKRKFGKKYKDMTPAQKRKAIARSKAGVYHRRGRLKKKPCADCGKRAEEKHHENYDEALEVIWLCRKCHLRRHAEENDSDAEELNALRQRLEQLEAA